MAKKAAKKVAKKAPTKAPKVAKKAAPKKNTPKKSAPPAPDKSVTTTVSLLTTIYDCIHQAKAYEINNDAISRLIEAETLIESLILKAK